MAATSVADKLAKLEKKIAKREKAIADETKELDKDRAEYNKLYIMFLSDKYKLSGKDLFSAIEREHEQLEKLREGEQSDDDANSNSSVTDDEDKQDDTAVKHSSFPHIKVRVTYPDKVNDTIRQQKINKMYDIFLGAMRRNGTKEKTE